MEPQCCKIMQINDLHLIIYQKKIQHWNWISYLYFLSFVSRWIIQLCTSNLFHEHANFIWQVIISGLLMCFSAPVIDILCCTRVKRNNEGRRGHGIRTGDTGLQRKATGWSVTEDNPDYLWQECAFYHSRMSHAHSLRQYMALYFDSITTTYNS